MKNKQKSKWWLWWILQFISTLILSVLAAYCYYLGSVIHNILIWGLLPLFGAFTACLCTVRGLWNYAAWIVPPVTALLGNSIVFGFPLTPGPVFMCAFISLIGAATGEVLKRSGKKPSRH